MPRIVRSASAAFWGLRSWQRLLLLSVVLVASGFVVDGVVNRHRSHTHAVGMAFLVALVAAYALWAWAEVRHGRNER